VFELLSFLLFVEVVVELSDLNVITIYKITYYINIGIIWNLKPIITNRMPFIIL
jgi:hypothetical protein